MEQLDYNLLFRWFVGLSVDGPVWVPTVFSKNRDRLLEGDADATGGEGTALRRAFSVDGTLIEAWARLAQGSAERSLVKWPDEGSMKSFRRTDGQDELPGPGRHGERNCREEKRFTETHASTTDPDARPEAALVMRRGLPGGRGADEAYDVADFVARSRAAGVTPHVTQNITTHRGSNLDADDP